MAQTFVEIQQWCINHSTDYWRDPWNFRPERFLKEGDMNYDNVLAEDRLEALQPFIAGPRNCIGRK
jgi:cytochrome P450